MEFRVNSAVSDLHAADGRYHKSCMSMFFSNCPSGISDVPYDNALDKLITELRSDRTRIWNSLELHDKYKELDGMHLSRRSLIAQVSEILHPDLLVLSSPGVASILLFRSNASDQLHIIDDASGDSNAQAITELSKTIRSECEKPDPLTYPTWVSMDHVVGKCLF